MPFDGTDLGFFENHPLTKLDAVERLPATKQLWCKFPLRDRDGRYCLVGAMRAVKARQLLEPIILRAAREVVGGKHYWWIECIANIIKGHQRRSRRQRLAQAVRALCSGSAGEAYAALRFGAIRTPRPSPKAPAVTLPTATPAGILVVVFATVVPDLKAAHLNSAEREGQPVIVHIIEGDQK
jgi:hypothetical protein